MIHVPEKVPHIRSTGFAHCPTWIKQQRAVNGHFLFYYMWEKRAIRARGISGDISLKMMKSVSLFMCFLIYLIIKHIFMNMWSSYEKKCVFFSGFLFSFLFFFSRITSHVRCKQNGVHPEYFFQVHSQNKCYFFAFLKGQINN